MRQQERIARTVAKRKAKKLFKHWRPDEINCYVESHYCDYLTLASNSINHHHTKSLFVVLATPVCLFFTSLSKAVSIFFWRIFR
ncbi:MAG: hypothetical protein HQL69_08935 [Magnetococcales bacterium]|nr:hypothetical protein [Magnetococcales bacterium]